LRSAGGSHGTCCENLMLDMLGIRKLKEVDPETAE
jgi:hypothetical protein